MMVVVGDLVSSVRKGRFLTLGCRRFLTGIDDPVRKGGFLTLCCRRFLTGIDDPVRKGCFLTLGGRQLLFVPGARAAAATENAA